MQDFLVYTTTRANQSVQLIYRQQYAKKITLEDGTDVPITETGALNYRFPEAGEHKVWIEFKEDIITFSWSFFNCPELTSIPENLFANNTVVIDFSFCFSSCTRLTSIPANLFANNTAVTIFSNCFSNCIRLTGNVPVDTDGTPIYNRSGRGKDGYAIVRSCADCFRDCSGLTGYNSIPSGWK